MKMCVSYDTNPGCVLVSVHFLPFGSRRGLVWRLGQWSLFCNMSIISSHRIGLHRGQNSPWANDIETLFSGALSLLPVLSDCFYDYICLGHYHTWIKGTLRADSDILKGLLKTKMYNVLYPCLSEKSIIISHDFWVSITIPNFEYLSMKTYWLLELLNDC